MAPQIYDITHKQTFTNQLLALPPNAIPQIIGKVQILSSAPAPDAKSKKKLVGPKHPTYRLRSGDYRIIYTFNEAERWVALLGVDARKDVYRNGILVDERITASVPGELADKLLAEYTQEFVASSETALNVDDEVDTVAVDEGVADDCVVEPATSAPLAAPANDDLPRAVTPDLLRRLRILDHYHPALIHCTTVDDLARANVPEDVRWLVLDAVDTPDFDVVHEQPSLVAQELEDFQRYYDGELVTFLLRLDPEQQRFVNWGVHGAGPTLVKGGPGSGKTVIALYRVQVLIEALRASGIRRPRILFTAYTNTLVTAARQMLRQLLGPDDAACVEIFTVDKLARDILDRVGAAPKKIVDDGEARAVVKRALDTLAGGSAEDQRAYRALEAINLSYLLEEIDTVIVARECETLERYLAESRIGRGRRLTQAQRAAVWRVHEEWERIAAKTDRCSWAQFRRRAVDVVRAGHGPTPYDGVLIDEAQDLQPTTLRLLVALCMSKDRLFLTADPNQSIYGSSFRWADVHEDLQFRGRTGVLRTNYRSTQQIVAGAETYLHGAELEEPEGAALCPRQGARPQIRFCPTKDTELHTLAGFFLEETRRIHKGLSGCAVLTPTNHEGQRIAQWLTAQGLRATFMARENIRLDAPEIKVVTLQSAKGLEFPVVALAGFPLPYPEPFPPGTPEDERQERLLRFRRTLYVGMTRAMHALLVVAPEGGWHLTPEVFDPALWDIGHLAPTEVTAAPWIIPPSSPNGVQISQAGSRR